MLKEEESGVAQTGITLNGLRLSARETLRKLRALEPSQSVAKENVPRLWFLCIPRGFEDRVHPYTVDRANYDSLKILMDQAVPLDVDLVPEWWPVGFGSLKST